MKILLMFLLLPVLAVMACTSMVTTDPLQKAINTTAEMCKNADAAILATDGAVLAKSISKSVAETTLKGLTIAQTGCVSSLGALKASVPASGVK